MPSYTIRESIGIGYSMLFKGMRFLVRRSSIMALGNCRSKCGTHKGRIYAMGHS